MEEDNKMSPVEFNHKMSPAKDARAYLDSTNIAYKTLHQFRVSQMQDGVDTTHLTDSMWGIVPLQRCHHVSCVTNAYAVKRSPSNNANDCDYPLTTYRVRICKTCCGETGHIELGTYNDQESAMLVNDAFEILQGRHSRLLVLRPEDQPYFDRLFVQRCDRSKGKEQVSLLEVIAERKRHMSPHPSSSNMSSFESRKRSSPSSGFSSADLGSSAKRQARNALSASASITSEESLSRPSSNGRNIVDGIDGSPDDYSEDDSSTTGEGEDQASSMAVDDGILVSPPVAIQVKRPSPNSALKLMDDNKQPNVARQRSYTFSTASEYFPALNTIQSGIDTLTWIASLDEKEADAALSLFAMTAHDRSVFESTPSAGETSVKSESEGEGSSANTLSQRGRSDSFAEISGKQVVSKTSSAKKQVVIMTPCKDSVISEDGERKDTTVVDKLSLLATSAGLLASPVQRNGQLQYSLDLSPLRSFVPSHIQSSLDDPSSSMSYRRARSQSMSAIDPPYNGFGGGNNSNAANMLKSNPNDPNALPIMRVLHQSHTHLLLQSITGAGLRGEGFIGIYSPEERKARIERFLEKRKHRMWLKKVKYDVRKNFADSRVRIKGRFVKKEEEKIAILMHVTDEKPVPSTAVSTPGSVKKSSATEKRKDSRRVNSSDSRSEDNDE